MCRQTCLRQLAPWAIVAVTGVAVMVVNARYFINFIGGPFIMGPAQLGAVLDPTRSLKYFAQVSGDRAIDTGIQEITVAKRDGIEVDRIISASYYALDLGGKFLIVKSESGQALSVEGELTRFPASLERQLFDTAEVRSMRDRFYSFYLDAGSFRTAGYITLSLWLAFAALAAWKALPVCHRLKNPTTHPAMLHVASWGDPIQISAEIENELRSTGGIRGYWTFTSNYMIESSFFRFNVLRFRDLVWAYKSVTKKSVNFIPRGTDYHALFICYGGRAVVQGPEKAIDEMLQAAAQRAPWAIFGYTEDLKKAFNEHTREFCAAVEDRRRRV